jgi:hypothetical protein
MEDEQRTRTGVCLLDALMACISTQNAVCSLETSVKFRRTLQRHIPEDAVHARHIVLTPGTLAGVGAPVLRWQV